jgi:hypothetical protein
MGAWGNGVWQDDVAHDAIAMFEELREDGYDAQEALQRVLADPPWGWGDRGDDAVQILAIAALALQHGVLDPALRDRAIAMIESGAPLGRWTESGPEMIAARTEVLERFKALLQRGSATPEELKEVTTPEAFSLW